MEIRYSLIFKIIIWLSLGLLNLLFIDVLSIEPYDTSTQFLGILIILFGLINFWIHGGKFITPTGVFMLTTVVFSGMAAIYATNDNYINDIWLWLATLIAFYCQVITFYFFLDNKNMKKVIIPDSPISTTNFSVLLWGLKLGILLFLLGIIASLLGYKDSALAIAASFDGIVIIIVSIWSIAKKKTFIKIIFSLVLFSIYYFYIFNNFGRITLASLVLALLLGITYKFKNKTIKILIIIGLVPAIIFASIQRAEFTGELNPIQSSEITGFESAVSPLVTFGELMKMNYYDTLELQWGKTIWAAIVTFIPRDLWIEKPQTFGREITIIFTPELVRFGHSEASITFGEWIYNFGNTGILFAILFLGFSIRKLDRVYVHFLNKKFESKWNFINFISILIVTSGILDFYWGGFSTFMTRGGIRLLVLYTCAFLLLFIFKKYKKKHCK